MEVTLITIVSGLAILATVQLIRVFELSGSLKKNLQASIVKEENTITKSR